MLFFYMEYIGSSPDGRIAQEISRNKKLSVPADTYHTRICFLKVPQLPKKPMPRPINIEIGMSSINTSFTSANVKILASEAKEV